MKNLDKTFLEVVHLDSDPEMNCRCDSPNDLRSCPPVCRWIAAHFCYGRNAPDCAGYCLAYYCQSVWCPMGNCAIID